jgi:hypothetical protein
MRPRQSLLHRAACARLDRLDDQIGQEQKRQDQNVISNRFEQNFGHIRFPSCVFGAARRSDLLIITGAAQRDNKKIGTGLQFLRFVDILIFG